MKFYLIRCLTLVTGILYSLGCNAWSGSDLYAQLNRQEVPTMAYAYIYGVIDTSHSSDFDPRPDSSMCYELPEPFDIQAIGLVVNRYLMLNSDKLTMHAPQLILMALVDQYPAVNKKCRYELNYNNS